MKNIILFIGILTSSFLTAQPLVNHCQQMHNSFAAINGKSAQLVDYSISHYDLHVDSINYGQSELRCHVGVRVVAQTASVSGVQLDLLGFDIDSIVCTGFTVGYNYNDTVIDIQLLPAIALGDSAEIWVYYHGTPAMDASLWGGFYFSGAYAFNLGVGFAADPHNFGRAWFPCIDNFVSRSSYDFYITTAATSKAFCNGTLQQSVTNPNGTITWHWRQSQTIPTYLASMAVAPYYTLERTSNGIPVQWAAVPADTNNVLATFANLDTILYSFINAYGPYPFDKVGYCLIPFNSGAMEHAASIHIGRAFVNGSQTYATLWAHELSHMWWGDKVTCETQEEMWLNEGFASFNEAYYTEIINGPAAYRDWIRSNHRKVVQFAHTPVQDGSYLTMNAIPHEYTYGYHVYQKGADIVHTLRNYMGDAGFFAGSQAYMNNKAYSDASSSDLRDELTAGSGINMNRFFDDWIFTPGFPHFSIDSVIHVPAALDHMYVYTRQRSQGNNNHLYEMPIQINFSDGIQDTSITVVIDSLTNLFHIPIYFAPAWTTIDRNEKVSDAISSNEKLVISTGSLLMTETNVTLNIQLQGIGPDIVRTEHNFVAPDPFININPGIKLSDYHYWKISGIFSIGFLSKGTFVYDGSTSASTGYLDNNLITGNEDSLLILYRPGAGFNWEPVGSFIHNMGSAFDKRGSFTVDTLLQGEYTIGMYDYTVTSHELNVSSKQLFSVSPNPSGGSFTFKILDESLSDVQLCIYDLGGRVIYVSDILKNNSEITWQGENNRAGVYRAVLRKEGKNIAGTSIVLTR